ncbi:MAG: hypothetical protein ACO3HT_10175 [Ilumatobacteraceae bacterium]
MLAEREPSEAEVRAGSREHSPRPGGESCWPRRVARLEEQLRHEHDAKGAAELGKAHARLAAAGGVTGTNAASH